MPSDFSPKVLAVVFTANILLIILSFSSAFTDVTRKKIYNRQTYPAMIFGLLLAFTAWGWEGAMMSLLGLIVGSSLLFIFYLTGGVGAGDIKLLGAIGALKGSVFVLWTMFYTGLVGGIMAFTIIIWKGTFRSTMKDIIRFLRHPLNTADAADIEEYQYIPYGLAISIGAICALCTVRA